jgi:BolA protein
MSIRDRIINKLTSQLSPELLEVIDDSNSHAGHAGWKESGETHFNVLIISSAFENKSKVVRHKMVYSILAEEMRDKVHALSVKAFTSAEHSD